MMDPDALERLVTRQRVSVDNTEDDPVRRLSLEREVIDIFAAVIGIPASACDRYGLPAQLLYANATPPSVEFVHKQWSDLYTARKLNAVFSGLHATVQHPQDPIFDAVLDIADGLTGYFPGPGGSRFKARVQRAPAFGRKYVVVSDLHWLERHSRNWFQNWPQHEQLYRKALGWYADNGYVLVENGDVEDLVIFEPTWSGALAMRAFELGLHGLSEADEHRFRTRLRLRQLEGIVGQYADLRSFIARSFGTPFSDGQPRFVKLVGNHDVDLKSPEFARHLAPYLDVNAISDVLVLEGRMPGRSVAPQLALYFIAHGHQFDAITNERSGPAAGEMMSEAAAWFKGGADRVWAEPEWQREWTNKGYQNVAAALGFRLQRDSSGIDGAPTKKRDKIRHLVERRVHRKLAERFSGASHVPGIVFGHTHEVKASPRLTKSPFGTRRFDNYINTGSAGRYENLIWCSEIVDGDAHVHAWRYVDGQPTRFVLQPQGHHKLVPVRA